MNDKEQCTTGCNLDEVIEMLCKEDPSFKNCLDEAKKELDKMTIQEQNDFIDNVFRRLT